MERLDGLVDKFGYLLIKARGCHRETYVIFFYLDAPSGFVNSRSRMCICKNKTLKDTTASKVFVEKRGFELVIFIRQKRLFGRLKRSDKSTICVKRTVRSLKYQVKTYNQFRKKNRDAVLCR